jgi:hypothetical protein
MLRLSKLLTKTREAAMYSVCLFALLQPKSGRSRLESSKRGSRLGGSSLNARYVHFGDLLRK